MNNDLYFSYKSNKDIFNIYNHIKVVLNHPIHERFNFTRLILSRVIQTKQEIKYL